MRHFFYSIAALLFLLTCTPPPPLQKEEVPPVVALMFTENKFSTVAASGEAHLSIDGEVHRGTIEVHWDSTGKFNADFYAPLGIIVGSIKADSNSGTVTFDEGAYSFAMSQTMDTLPFAWGRDLTFGELISILIGKIPVIYAARLQRLPDFCVNERKTISALWKTDSLDIQATIRKRSREAESFTLIFKRRTPFRSVTFRSFSRGQVHKIELRENDRNYFSIKYTKVKYN
jgi:hypothetical protein